MYSRALRYSILFVVAACFTGCEDIFDVTPYDTPSDQAAEKLTEKNIALWQQRSGSGHGPMTIALTTDPHFHYGDLGDVVAHINARPAIDAVIVAGDLTDQGLLGEFELFTDVMNGMDKPWITVIGNHDHLSNGSTVYERMLGARNYTVDIREYRFIFFDDVNWESDETPDLAWLQAMLATTGERIPIVIAHIPPNNDQLTDGLGVSMRQLLIEHDVPLFIHGHIHAYQQYTDGVAMLSLPWPAERMYVLLTMQQDHFTIEPVAL